MTKYGGMGSHMAIRCAELNIPAAIGCGHKIFKNLQNNTSITMNCNEGKIITDSNHEILISQSLKSDKEGSKYNWIDIEYMQYFKN